MPPRRVVRAFGRGIFLARREQPAAVLALEVLPTSVAHLSVEVEAAAQHELATDHRLFGKTIMRIGLFNKASERLGTVSSEVITADNASFSFEIPAEHAKPLWDLIIWFRKP